MNPLPHLLCPLRHRAWRTLRLARSLLAATLLCAAPSLHAQPANPAATFTGQLQDSTGAIIPNAKVELQRPNGAVITSAITDATGHFRIAQPAAGYYLLTIALPGFDPLARPLRITAAPLAPLTLTLNLASVSTSVTVNADQNADISAPDQNQDVPTITSNDMKTLPILDGDIISTLSAFLDAGATGEGGVALMIDGVEMKSLGVDPSAIERITINQDPYTARYRQPGKGQIDVTTKNTSTKFHGALNFAFRDSALNAVNHFAKTKPPEQRRTYGGYLTGPIKPLPNTTFLFSANRREQSFSQQVNATTAAGVITENVPAPATNTTLSMKVAHQINDHHSAFLLYRLYDSSASNQNVGGLTLSSAGSTAYNFDQDLTFHDDYDFSPTALNQFSFVFERSVDRTVSNQPTPALIVQGAFIGGGAQADTLQTETKPNITEIVSWTTHKIHQLRFGLQLTNLGPFVLEDNTNRQGTYTFASLADFEANTPSSYSLQQGQSSFHTYLITPSGFVQDQIQLTPSLSITPGVRYDFQSTLSGTKDAVLPRVSLAYVLDKKHALVVRTGSGVYMRRVGGNVSQQLARYEHAAERSLLITTNLCYPDITVCNTLAAQPPNLFNFEPNLKSPMQAYFGLSVERQLTAKSTITLSYDGYRGWHALRSVDVNAPLPPFTSADPPRPNPNFAQILQLQSRGYQKSDAMTLSYRGRIGNVFSGFMDYILQHADSNTQWSTFIPQNQYNPNDEWSRTNNDQRQQFKFFGTFYPDKPLTLGIGFYNYTPAPYTITTGTDDYHTGFYNARPAGVPRNSLNGASYQDLQVRLGYVFKLQPHLKDESPTLAVSISSFNTLNRPNYEGFVGVNTSSLFKRPTSADPPRRLQLGASYNF